jgi:hypothetical protein
VLPAQKGGHERWQDLGARVVWQGGWEVGHLLAEAGTGQHAVVVSSRFQAPPPAPFAGETLTWVYLPPEQALGKRDPTVLEALSGTPTRAFLWLFRLPFPAGAEENGFFAQLGLIRSQLGRLSARKRLRAVAMSEGRRVMAALAARGDTVYRLEPGAGSHRLVGMVAGAGKRSAA